MDEKLTPEALALLAKRASTVAGRLSIVQDHAERVFGRPDEVAAWMSCYHPSILNGLCPVSLACQNPEGFLQAMAELGRIAARRILLGPASPQVRVSEARPRHEARRA